MATRVTSPSDQKRTAVTLPGAVVAGAPKEREQTRIRHAIRPTALPGIEFARVLLDRSERKPAMLVDELLQLGMLLDNR